MIACPRCSSPTTVLETRGDRRRRACDALVCGHRFSTMELVCADGRRDDETVVISKQKLKTIVRLANAALGGADGT